MEASTKPVLQVDTSRELEIKKKHLRDNCREFESVMVSYLMKTMRGGVIRAEEPDSAQAMYEDMLDGQISKTVANTSALGIGDMLYAKLESLVKTKSSKQTAGIGSDPTPPVESDPANTSGSDKASPAEGTKELP